MTLRCSTSRNAASTCSAFVFAQQAVIDEDARQLFADRARDERRRDGRIDAAGERADHFVVADLRANVVDRPVDVRAHLPIARQAGDTVQKVLQQRPAVFACARLRGGTACRRYWCCALPIAAIRQRAVDASTSYPGGSLVTVSPCDIHTRDSGATPAKSGDSDSATQQRRRPVLGVIEFHQFGVELPRHQLHAVTDRRGSANRCARSAGPCRARRA